MPRIRSSGRSTIIASLALLFTVLAAPVFAQQGDAPAMVAPVEGPIGPHVTRQITRAIDTAEARDSPLLILRIDTPGGLVTATRDIVKAILAAPVPVAVHVAPQGARAASAGTYILYGAHVAAMAPGTNLGAATPVSMGGGGPGGGQIQSEAPEGADRGEGDADGAEEGGDPPASEPSALEKKRINDAVAWIRSLAELRGRNADWAEDAVRDGASLSADAALDTGVIDTLAADTTALLEAADGREVEVAGSMQTLATRGAPVERIEPSWQTRVLGILANPNVALLLMTLGFYGLVFELSSPGLGPGIPGFISLLLGLYALNTLPLNYAALALMGAGLALIAVEAFSPGLGVPGIGGALAFAVGAALVVDTDVAAYRIDLPVIAAVTALTLAVVTLILGAVWRSFARAPRASSGRMDGTEGQVLSWADGEGRVRAHGEDWAATGPPALAPGAPVRVVRVKGLTLTVEPAETLRGRET